MRYIILLTMLAITALSSCRTAPPFVFAPVEITTKGNKITVKQTGPTRPMPDTTVTGYWIKRRLQ